tara:strand:- start:487 stop:2598 length:2112 start_codon:yes stop_codon:yes gene_type:complete
VAESIVTLRVEARNAISSLNKTSAATKTLSNSAKGATASLTTASTAAKGLGASLATTLGPLITVGAAIATVSNAIGTFTARERDIAILTQGLKNLGAGTAQLNELQKAADKLGNQTLFNQEEFTRGFNLLTSFRKIGVDAYERVAQAAADIAQVNQVDVNTSFMQLAKALQDPARNLSNLNRSGIAFTKTQQDVIKELMETNKTAEAHAMILGIVEESYNKLSQAAAEGFAGNVDSLGEAFRDFSETLGKALEPALIAATKGLTTLIKAADELLKSPLGKTIAIFTGIALAVKGTTVAIGLLTAAMATASGVAGVLAIAMNAIPFVAIATGIGAVITQLIKQKQEQDKVTEAIKQGELAQLRALESNLNIKMAKELAIINNSNDKRSINAAKNRLRVLQDEIKPIRERLKIAVQENAVDVDKKKTKKENEEIEKEINKLIKDNLKKTIAYEQAEMNKVAAIGEFIGSQSDSLALLRSQIEEKGEQVALEQAINNAVKIYGEEYRDIITNYLTANEELKKQKDNIDKNKEAAEKLKEQFRQIGEETRQGLVENLKEAINGSQTLGQALNKVLNNLKNKLLDIALNKAISNIGNILGGGSSSGFTGFLSGLFGKERGGPVSAGGAYVVGERGPEILQMGSKGGNIIPNSQIDGGGSVTNIVNVSVDASGTSTEGDGASGEQLGRLIGAAVQAELIKEKRPGGLLG